MPDFVTVELRYNSDASPVRLDALMTLSAHWSSITYTEGVDQSCYKFEVTYTGLQTLKLLNSVATKDLHAVLSIAGIPMAYGFLVKPKTHVSKGAGAERVLHFETFLGLLARQSINPHQSHWVGTEPITQILAQIIKINGVQSLQVQVDPTAFKIAYNSSAVADGVGGTFDSGVKPIGIKDLQPKADESAFVFLQRICRRHGYLLRDSVTTIGGITQPLLILAPPRILTPSTLESITIDAAARNPIINLQGQSAASNNVKVTDVSLEIDEYMPVLMVGYGVSNNPDVTASSYKCAVFNELLANSVGYGSPDLMATYGVTEPLAPDLFKAQLGSNQQTFQTQYVVVEKRQWTDCMNINEIANRTLLELWERQNQAYQLTYQITQHDKPPMLSDDFAYVQDDYVDPITSIMYIQSVQIHSSKDQGYTQSVNLRIPNTYRVGNL